MTSESVSFTKRVADDSGAGLIILDRDGRVLDANEAYARLFGRRGASELVGLRLHDFMPAPAADERVERVRAVMDGGRPLVVHDLWGGVAIVVTGRRVEPCELAPTGAAMAVYRPSLGGLIDTPTDPAATVVWSRHVDLGPLSALTDRELEVLALIGHGLTQREIAARLFRAVKTIEWHRTSLGTKLGVTRHSDLVRVAIRAGLPQRYPLDAGAEARAMVPIGME